MDINPSEITKILKEACDPVHEGIKKKLKNKKNRKAPTD